jgi:hypothetical protein
MDEERKLQTVEGSENKAVIPLCCVDLYIARTYYRSVQRGVLICLARPPPPYADHTTFARRRTGLPNMTFRRVT